MPRSPFSSRKNSRTASPAQRTRKPNRLQRLWQKATSSTANKALYGSLVAIVGTIAALFLTSRGSLAPSWNIFRDVVSKIPGVGKRLVWLVQTLIDLFMSVIGVGLKPGMVVTFRDVKKEIVEKEKYKLADSVGTGNKTSDGKNTTALKIEEITVNHKKITDETKFIVIQAKHGAPDVHIAPYPDADVPTKAKLPKWCKHEDQKKSFSYAVVIGFDTKTGKDKPFPVPRTLLQKADQDDQITE